MSSRGIIDLRPVRENKKFSTRRPLPGQMRMPGGFEPPKPLPLRARRRRKRALIALAGILLAGGLVWLASYASYLPRFSISNVTVSGAHDVSPDLIHNYAETLLNDGSYHLFSRSNIFLYPRYSIEQGIAETFPRIKSVHVSLTAPFATTMNIAVTERQRFALWCDESTQCYLMDDGGFIFTEASSTASGTQYLFKGGVASSSQPIGQTFIKTHFFGLLAFLRYLGQAGFTSQGATVENEQDFSVPLTSGFLIKASFGEDAQALAKNLQLVLSSAPLNGKEQEIEYIDLRFGNRVYYKLKGQVEATAPQQ